jgi:xanthine dehydrogenase molybdopterin-binding subunit B
MKYLYRIEIGDGCHGQNVYWVVAKSVADAMKKVKDVELAVYENAEFLFMVIELKAHSNGALIV